MRLRIFFLNLVLKIRENFWPFLLVILFWLGGAYYFFRTEPENTIEHALLVSILVRSPTIGSDFGSAYRIIFQILLEVVVFSFIFGTLFQRYNPTVTAELAAKRKRHHSIVIGYHHLGERIIDHLREKGANYAVLEHEEDLVEDLVSIGEPVVIGNERDDINLRSVGIPYAREVFVVSEDSIEAIIITEKVRKMNKKCAIYVRVYEEKYFHYLSQPPLNALPFSTSKWALLAIEKWAHEQSAPMLVIGQDHLVSRVVDHCCKNRTIYVLTAKSEEPIKLPTTPKVKSFSLESFTMEDVQSVVNLRDISQVFICWNEIERTADSVYLASELHEHFPDIQCYVRIFDEEIGNILKRYNTTPFSTSSFAFENLQMEVSQKSAIAPRKKKKKQEKGITYV